MNISQSSETVILASTSQNETLDIGFSLCASLYPAPVQERCGAGKTNTAIWLRGELGSGKTTFVQGLGLGLGLGTITSPTYALENRYGEKLLHLDLFRLEPEEAKQVVRTSEEFPGIRVIEWCDRLTRNWNERVEEKKRSSIHIHFHELSKTERRIEITFADLSWPDRKTIEKWREEVHLPKHIVKHCDAVAALSKKLAEEFLRRGKVCRPQAIEQAALLHDLLRFIDFFPKEDRNKDPKWKEIAEKYPMPHEEACARFVEERGYPELGAIIRPHGLCSLDEPETIQTTEQKILFYADKRIMVDKVVTLDERFDDFIERYGKGIESEEAKKWREKTKALERELFGEEVP